MVNKRPPIEVSEISQNLKSSTGQGFNAFFSQPSTTPSVQEVQERKPLVPRNPGTEVPRYQGTKEPLARREIKRRHPFDVYVDQLRTLKKFSIEEKQAGGIGSESAMVRAALDAFIAKRRKDAA